MREQEEKQKRDRGVSTQPASAAETAVTTPHAARHPAPRADNSEIQITAFRPPITDGGYRRITTAARLEKPGGPTTRGYTNLA